MSADVSDEPATSIIRFPSETSVHIHQTTWSDTARDPSLKCHPYYIVSLSRILLSLFDIICSHAFPKCVEVRTDELRWMWRGQCKWNSKLTTALKARQVSFLLLAACAWRNLFPRETMWFPSSFELDHLTNSWHHPACHVEGKRMMTWHKTAWPYFHIPFGVIRHFGGLQDVFNKMFWGRHPHQGVTVPLLSLDSILIFRVLVLWVISFGFTKPSATPWRLGRSQSQERRRTFTPWRGCLSQNILWILSPRKLQDLQRIFCNLYLLIKIVSPAEFMLLALWSTLCEQTVYGQFLVEYVFFYWSCH